MSNQVVEPKLTPTTATLNISVSQLPVTVSAGNLASGDEVPVQQKRGTVFENTGKKLTASEPQLMLQCPGVWRLDKDNTTNAVSLHVDGDIGDHQIDITGA